MPILSRPAFGPVTALAYVTGGTLMCVWTVVWYYTREYQLSRSQWFWVGGIFLSGLTFVILGLILGRLGRAARQAELPPEEVATHEAVIQQTAAANPPAVVGAPAGGVVGAPMVNPSVPVVPAVVPAPLPQNPPAGAQVYPAH